MAHILSAVTGTTSDLIPIKRVLISVSDKTNIIEFCQFLTSCNKEIELLSTGGTAKVLRDAGLSVKDVSEYTGAMECLDGRVKTLHPKIHGGLLAVRGNEQHEKDMIEQSILPIDMTIVNLYPFEQTISKQDVSFEQCIENIDIGGPSMLRSTAKNFAYTTVVTNPNQYQVIQKIMEQNNGCTTYQLRKQLACTAFTLSSYYDSMIANYFTTQLAKDEEQDGITTVPPLIVRAYQPQYTLKYGCNPHQNPAMILSRMNQPLPFTVVNGTPGYINLLDACNAYQLVTELKQATNGLPAAASFKHVSPAGAAVAVPLSSVEQVAYEITDDVVQTLTPTALAYLRARNADPMCSYGDFSAVSDIVDEATAKFLKTEVSDGIIAPGYTPEAMAILSKKKGGKFIILQATEQYNPGDIEYREVYGMTFSQKRNHVVLNKDHITSNIVTSDNNNNLLSDDAIRDLLIASICIKYTQSNSVGFSKNGMMIGVGAGQQSRVDCVKLAGKKVRTWYLRQHPKVLNLPFKSTGVKRQDRVNARVRYIEGDFTSEEKEQFDSLFDTVPEPLTENEKDDFMKSYASGVSISSDAFFPFRDSIDHASKYGVSYVAQPGGSVQDKEVIDACNTYKMIMAFTGVRLFHH